MNNSKEKLSFEGKWKEYIKIEKMTLLSKVMEWLHPFDNEQIEHEV